jgi:hypothetical protein
MNIDADALGGREEDEAATMPAARRTSKAESALDAATRQSPIEAAAASRISSKGAPPRERHGSSAARISAEK